MLWIQKILTIGILISYNQVNRISDILFHLTFYFVEVGSVGGAVDNDYAGDDLDVSKTWLN